jgi:3-phenylpropionate/trans-cinnamate dioxygenase ferredoxin reductase subunit
MAEVTMTHYKYLIIGGGMTADAAISGILEVDPAGSIGLIGQEADRPYNRPPLTKALWKGDQVESVWRNTPDKNVTLHLGRTAQTLDPQNKYVTDDQGQEYTYDKLLLATGGRPRRLHFGEDKIIYFRTLADYNQLRRQSEQHQTFLVLGGGFIGSEIAAALTMNGKKVVMAFPGKGIGAGVFPADLSRFLNEYYREKGVEILPGELISGLLPHKGQLLVTTRNVNTLQEREFLVDGAVAGLGIEPNVELALASGLKVENGIVVNASLQTSHPDIYAAGDVAAFYSPQLGRYRRVEHEDNSNTMGRLAGRSMAGSAEAYDTYLPSFYSDLFELGYEAVGELDSRLETVADWKEPFREGVIYYLLKGRVRGVLLWNVWGQVDTARNLLAQPGPFQADNLIGRIISD